MLNKIMSKLFLIDIACPFDPSVGQKEKDKIEIYNLTNEIKRLWWCKDVMIIPVVVGALCTVSTKFEMWLKKIKINISIPLLQKACPYVKGKILQQIPKKLLKESPLHLDRYQTYKTGSNIYTKLKLNYINNNNQDLQDLLLLSSKK